MSKAMAPEGWRCAGAAFALSLVFAPLGHAASNDSFTIDSVSPPEAVPGAQVILQGSGFGTSAEELFAWVAGPDSGFPLEVLTADDGQLRARVGATAEPLSGTLTLWKGQPLRLADGVLAAGGRLFTMTDTRLLVVTRTAAGPSFSSLAGSPAAVGSTGLGRSMVVNVATLGDILVGTGPARGRVDVVVATNGEPCNPPGGAARGSRPPGRLPTAARPGSPAGTSPPAPGPRIRRSWPRLWRRSSGTAWRTWRSRWRRTVRTWS